MRQFIHRLCGAAWLIAGAALLSACTTASPGPGGYQGTATDFMQIYQLFQKYNYDINIDDGDAWASDFTPDGVFQDPSNCAIGREALSNVPGHHVSPGKDVKTFHFSMPGTIAYIDRNHATVHSDVLVVAETGAGKSGGINITGAYDDKLTRLNGQWKFAYRFVQRPNKTPPIACAPQIPNGFHYVEWP
jgi:hypothetical protein